MTFGIFPPYYPPYKPMLPVGRASTVAALQRPSRDSNPADIHAKALDRDLIVCIPKSRTDCKEHIFVPVHPVSRRQRLFQLGSNGRLVFQHCPEVGIFDE